MIFFQMLHCMISTKHPFATIATTISSIPKMSCIVSASYFKKGPTDMWGLCRRLKSRLWTAVSGRYLSVKNPVKILVKLQL